MSDPDRTDRVRFGGLAEEITYSDEAFDLDDDIHDMFYNENESEPSPAAAPRQRADPA